MPAPITAVLRKDLLTCWAAAIGTIIIALTRSRPTVRMPITTVTAASTVIRVLMKRVGMPWV